MLVIDTPQEIQSGTTKTIINNPTGVNVYFALKQDAQEWIPFTGTIIVNYPIFVKTIDSRDIEIAVTKD